MPHPKQLRPDHHILGEARELLAEAEEEGLLKPGTGRTAQVLDGSAYQTDWADEEADAALARRGRKRTDGGDGK